MPPFPHLNWCIIWLSFYSTTYFCYWFFRLQIEGEKLFVNLSCVLALAMPWEERAREILSHETSISDFEDMIRFNNVWDVYFIFTNFSKLILAHGNLFVLLVVYRASENIFAILPSLNDVKDALSEANLWLRNSKPYLVSSACASNSLRQVEDLQVHVLSSLFYFC